MCSNIHNLGLYDIVKQIQCKYKTIVGQFRLQTLKTYCLAFVSYLKEEMTSWNNLIDCVSLKVCNTNLQNKHVPIYKVFINSECSVAISRSIEVTLHKLRVKLLNLKVIRSTFNYKFSLWMSHSLSVKVKVSTGISPVSSGDEMSGDLV